MAGGGYLSSDCTLPSPDFGFETEENCPRTDRGICRNATLAAFTIQWISYLVFRQGVTAVSFESHHSDPGGILEHWVILTIKLKH